MDKLDIDQKNVIEALLSGIGLGIVVTDVSGEVLLFNDAATNILGVGPAKTKVAPEEWPKQYGIYLPDGVTLCPVAESPIVRAIGGEIVDDLEVLVVPPEAQAPGRWCTINLRPLKNGSLEGAVLVIQDISERKRLVHEVTRSNAALQQFATVAAHDLQEPLRSVSGFIDMLEEELGEGLSDNSSHYMTRIKTAVKHMKHLINDLLAFSRVQSRPNVPTPVNCNDLMARCIESLNASIQSTGAQVLCDPLPTIVADGPQLLQLFQNLIGNALKFSAKERPPLVHISAEKQGISWRFAVKDNGIGMDMQFADRIFVLFQRLHPIHAYPGTGIGLAVCKRIVDGCGGRIWIESEKGKGTTFFFTIPVRNHMEETQ
jgi:signal transduction histidine kinase